ncbi:YtxH domain-containing protein [Peribacillus alkalitolerans]|uniref:YtxH domain-containing protein n=1 Tax=Peribacillus alkalitolerans TaxID=1550385 RepID=UPI0013D60685|nr:YtxH domain-containing protein [Peribacillus alkalitolerans]
MNQYRGEYSYQQMGTRKNRLLQGIMLGALAGAAMSLMSRDTRSSVVSGTKQYSKELQSFIKNPNDFFDRLKETSGRIRKTVQQISDDVAFISQKVEEIKDVPPQVASMVKETKEAFISHDEQDAPEANQRQEQHYRNTVLKS